MKKYFLYAMLSVIIGSCTSNKNKSNIAIQVSFSERLSDQPIDGRMLLMLSNNDEAEPRFQIGEGLNNQIIFGQNVEGLEATESVSFTEEIFGYPISSLTQLKPGEYYVQALLHTYETFNLETGQTVKLPMDNGEGQKWNRSPGNLYSTPQKVTVTKKE